MEEELMQLEVKYPNNARGIAKFNVPLAHMLFAGADFIIVPTLVDTVKEGVTGFHMGSFSVECETVDPADATAVASTVRRALKQYDTPALHEMVQNCMTQDLSWKLLVKIRITLVYLGPGAAKKWEEVLLGLGVEGSQAGIDGEESLAMENVATP
ncbi:unnamed protein product [Miscanthus lutarioriparius]|uniref:Uncharacterized protein n=1 Tax=Miscanthus lutarioriparius TaxID=422564 RepID=A0A811N969_9POAL|nr:unnamed protein product [Miscanthus lutarioriparius]